MFVIRKEALWTPRYDQIKAKIAKRKESFTKKIDKMSPAQMLLHIQEIYKINAMLEVLQDPIRSNISLRCIRRRCSIGKFTHVYYDFRNSRT